MWMWLLCVSLRKKSWTMDMCMKRGIIIRIKSHRLKVEKGEMFVEQRQASVIFEAC